MYKHILHMCIIIIHVYNILKMNDFILKINDFFKKKQKLATVHAAYPHNPRIGDTLARAYIQSWNCIFFYQICICLILIDWLRPSSNPGIYVERIFIVNVYLIYIKVKSICTYHARSLLSHARSLLIAVMACIY